MLDLLYIRILDRLIRENVLLSDIPRDELANMLLVKIKNGMPIEKIEMEKKSIMDSLAKEFGILEVIKRIRRILTCNFRELKNSFLDTRTCADLNLFFISASTFATKLKEVYKPNIYVILELEFLRIENHTFDRESFKENIRREVLSPSYLLSSESQNQFSQDSLFESEQPKEISPYDSIQNSYSTRTSIMNEIKDRIRRLYSTYSITKYSDMLITILKSENSLEAEILIDLINSIKSELRRGQVKKKSFSKDANQLVLEPISR